MFFIPNFRPDSDILLPPPQLSSPPSRQLISCHSEIPKNVDMYHFIPLLWSFDCCVLSFNPNHRIFETHNKAGFKRTPNNVKKRNSTKNIHSHDARNTTHSSHEENGPHGTLPSYPTPHVQVSHHPPSPPHHPHPTTRTRPFSTKLIR